jgi:hypothetical protein
VAACGSDSSSGGGDEATTTSAPPPKASDVALLRLAASIEELEVALCQKGIDGLVKGGNLDTIKLLQSEHKQHAAIFQGHTTRLGGDPMMQANPVLAPQYLDRATDEGAVLRALYDLAQVAAATYQAGVGAVADHQLDTILMSVAGVEARQAALLGTMINQPVAATSLATTEKAVAAGTGV